MAKTYAQKHRERVLAQRESEAAAEQGAHGKNATAYEQQLAQLATHQRQLSKIQSQEQRAKKKLEYLPDYEAYLSGVLSSDAGVQDDVLFTCMIWYLDAQQIDRALELAEYVIKHQLASPERYKRTSATIIAEEVADAYFKDSSSVNAGQLEQVLELVAEEDIYDEVRAKLHKALGLALQDSNLSDAVMHLNRAYDLDNNFGAKKVLDALDKKLTKQLAETNQQEQAAENSAQQE